jgi:hypothetical protein
MNGGTRKHNHSTPTGGIHDDFIRTPEMAMQFIAAHGDEVRATSRNAICAPINMTKRSTAILSRCPKKRECGSGLLRAPLLRLSAPTTDNKRQVKVRTPQVHRACSRSST